VDGWYRSRRSCSSRRLGVRVDGVDGGIDAAAVVLVEGGEHVVDISAVHVADLDVCDGLGAGEGDGVLEIEVGLQVERGDLDVGLHVPAVNGLHEGTASDETRLEGSVEEV
jgi:hypothetical protein